MEKINFISRLKLVREKSGLTQKEIATKLNIPYTKYNHYETGRNQPDLETIIQISNFFGITCDYLLGHDTPESEEKNFSPAQERLIVKIKSADEEIIRELEQFLNFLESKKKG